MDAIARDSVLVGYYPTSKGSGPGGKKQKTKPSGKETASGMPSWARYYDRKQGESPEQFASRILNDKYNGGKWDKGAGSEYSQIVKGVKRAANPHPGRK